MKLRWRFENDNEDWEIIQQENFIIKEVRISVVNRFKVIVKVI